MRLRKILLAPALAVLIGGGVAHADDDDEAPRYRAVVDEFYIVDTPGENWRNVMTWCYQGVRFALTPSTGSYSGHGAAVSMVIDPNCLG